MRSYNGPGLLSSVLLTWIMDGKKESVLIEPGKPWQNGTNKISLANFEMSLAMKWFRNRLKAIVVIEDWRAHRIVSVLTGRRK